MTIKFNNYSMWIGKKTDYDLYEWCVFVNENTEVINNIKSVEYILHPTFPDPVRLIEENSNKFALFSSGWGEFLIKIIINFNDNTSSTTSYCLRLTGNWPRKEAPSSFINDEAKLVYQALLHEKYRWRKIDTIVKNSNLPTNKVLSILVDLETQDLVRKSPFLSIDGKEMWGATAVVGIAPKIISL